MKYEVLGFTSSKKEVKEAVEQYFGKEFSKIVECESGYNVRAVNYNTNKTIDRGAFQINSIHLKTAKKLGYDLSTVQGQFEYAKYLTIKEGYRPWVCKRVLKK